MIVAACIVLILGVSTFVIWAPFFRVHDVRIEGLTTLNTSGVATSVQSALQKKRYLLLPGDNVFLIKQQRIKEALNGQYHFAELNVTRKGRTLMVQAKERISEIAWISDEQTVLIDLQGMAISDANDATKAMIAARLANAAEIPVAPGLQPTMPILENLQGDGITLGETLIPDSAVTFILETDTALRQRGISPVSYRFDNPEAPWFTVTTTGPELMFDFAIELRHALVMLDAVRDERENFSNLSYVDLRFGNHVYVKEP